MVDLLAIEGAWTFCSSSATGNDRAPARLIMAAPRNTEAFLKLARERFAQGQEASHKQRQRVLDDLAFYAGGEKQWDPETLRNRQAQQGVAGMPPVPARPCLTINKVREPVHQVLNQERQSDMGLELVPADDWGELAPPVSEEEIELREGLARRIQRDSEAADARTWAFTRSTIAGEGAYRILTRYSPGKSWDKEVYVARIFNQASVTWDPAHEQPDGSDAEWAFIGSDMAWDRYKREHPKNVDGAVNQIARSDEAQFRALGEEYPGWFKSEGETRSARVVEYFYTEWELRTLVKLADGSAAWHDELPEDLPADQILEEREVPKKTIKWAKIDGAQILDETDWEGPDMPIVKVLGEEMQPFDAERRVEGMVRPARDAQQGFNAMVSKWVESVGLAPIPPLEVGETNIGAYGAWYQVLNTRALPFVPYREFDDQSRPLQPPSRTNVDTPIQAIAQSVQMFDEAIKSTTMVPSVQLGQMTDRHLKAKGAINALIDQGQLGTSHFLDNLKRSLRYEGQIINNLLYPIYGRPGRLARMLTGEGEPQTVRISAPPNVNGALPGGQPYAQPGQLPNQPSAMAQPPQPPMGMAPMGAPAVPPGGPPSPAGPMGGPSVPAPKTYTLTQDANFNVIVKVSRNFDSRRAEEATTIGNLLQADPSQMAIYGDLFFKNQDGPGHEEMADRAKVMLHPQIQQYLASKEQGQAPLPPGIQAQMQQLQQKLQQAEGILAQAKQELEGKKQELELKLQIEREKMQHAEKLQAMKDATQLAVARLSAIKGVVDESREDHEEAIALAQQQTHEAEQAALDRQHELGKAQMGHQHALEMGQQAPPLDPNRQPGVP